MNVSLWGIRNPLPAALVFVVLCVFGLYGFFKLPISSLPDISFPQIQITINLPGATPSQLETDVTRRVEDAVASLPEIEKIISSVSEGASVTRIEFELGRDIDQALDEVRDALAQVRNELPQEMEEPIIARQTLIGGTLLGYAVQSDRMAPDELSWFVDDVVRKALFGVNGVGKVSRTGGVDREIRIDMRADALQAYGVTAGAVSQQLARLQLDRPGGRTVVGGSEQSVRTVATVQLASDLGNFSISLPDGRSVRLSALATVRDSTAEPRSAAMLDGVPVVGFSVQRTKGSSEVAVGKAARQRIAELQAEYPQVRFTEVASSVEEAKASFDSSMTMLWEGALLAVIVVWFFLRDWRATWISAIALPLSVIPTFGVMHLLDLSLNLLSLLAMAVVIGVLVDDAIVEVENVARHRAMGKSPMDAAIDASNEIGTAVIATSATLAAVFVPVAFISGVTGKFFREFGWTASVAVLFSLLVARLLTPMMAAYLMKGEPRSAADSAPMARYLGWVEWALDHRAKALLIALGTFIGSLAIVPFIPATFIPASDGLRTQLELELPPGSRLEETRQLAEEVRGRLKSIPELTRVFTIVGGRGGSGHNGGIGVDDIRNASLTLEFRRDRDRSIQQLEDEVRARVRDVPGIRTSFAVQGPGSQLEMIVSGRDTEQLAVASRELATAIRSLPGLGSVTSSASLLRPEIVIEPDSARAADLGVSTVDIADAARIATSGDFRQRLSKLNLPERQIPIRVQLEESALQDLSVLQQLRVPGARGPVPLSSVATIRESSGPALIDRIDRERTVTVRAELNGQPLGVVMKEVRKLQAKLVLPPGVHVVPAGDTKAFVELLLGFAVAMLTGVISIYVVLLLLFHSATQPLTILVAVPLCGAGAFGGLLISGYALSVPSLIGLLLLTGIATKNSILIVDYAIIGEHERGLPRREALIDACRKRARPVIMTTLAMGAGMLPIAFGLGADGDFRAPLGVAVIGGLITSTLLSLVVVPSVYAAVADLSDWWRARRRSKSGAGDAGPMPQVVLDKQ